ncbi:MAG: CoA transferase, partial [Alphaproteobacteria bacterium]|nr:CoA transferase [Alphaproteobacteria bacterium]
MLGCQYKDGIDAESRDLRYPGALRRLHRGRPRANVLDPARAPGRSLRSAARLSAARGAPRLRVHADPRPRPVTVTASGALGALWRDAGLPADALARVTLAGADPVMPSSFAVGSAAQAAIAAAALAATEIDRARNGRAQRVAVDMRHAAVECRSEVWLTIDGAEQTDLWDKIAGNYPCGDGRWVRLHTNFPHHRDGVLALLGCAHDRDAVGAALQRRSAFEIEDAAAAAGMCVTAMRSFAEWDAHPQGQAVAALPLVEITRIGDAPPRRWTSDARPLSGVRVVELTRVLAGPVCGRTLAAHGADVMLVTSPTLPSLPAAEPDTHRGKLSTAIDLRATGGRQTLEALVRDADVFVQGYRPGGLGALGFGPDDTARLRPGIVHVSLSAYGRAGPWHGRRGFDSLVQIASGFSTAEAEAAGDNKPKPLPFQALDHTTGYLMAAVAIRALRRRLAEGAGTEARLSLARTAKLFGDREGDRQ